MALRICFLVVVAALSVYAGEIGDSAEDEERVRVSEYLDEMSEILEFKYPSETLDRSASFSPVALQPEEQALLGLYTSTDIILTPEQAEDILDNLRTEFGQVDSAENRQSGKPPIKSEKRQSRKAGRPYMWPLPVAYWFDGSHAEAEKEIIRKGLAIWQDSTCISFEEFDQEQMPIENRPALKFSKHGSGCLSYVGRRVNKNSSQPVFLPFQCVTPGIVSHEIGHVLGLFHEHTRPTRDSYVKVVFEKIDSSEKPYYTKIADHQDIAAEVEYDHSSIMHYPSVNYAKWTYEKRRVILTEDGYRLSTLGQRHSLSFNDAKRINLHYSCATRSCKVKLAKKCQNGGYQDPKACQKCRCPPGTSGDFCENIATFCGGVVEVDACSSTELNPPENFNSGSCIWHVKSPSSLVFAFGNKPKVTADYFYDNCIDYVEIKANLTNLASPGHRFCNIGKSSGRVASSESGEAVVIYNQHSPSANNYFQLFIYSTCNSTPPNELTKECLLTPSGYDYQGDRNVPDVTGECQVWSGLKDYDFPDDDIENLSKCRNPDSSTSPWCMSDSFSNSCSNIPQCPRKNWPQSRECSTRMDGRDYLGTLATTRSGFQCKNWSETNTRNPDLNFMGGAWCFTNNPSFPREICQLESC